MTRSKCIRVLKANAGNGVSLFSFLFIFWFSFFYVVRGPHVTFLALLIGVSFISILMTSLYFLLRWGMLRKKQQ